MKLGDWGEQKAVRYLEKLGYVIVECNFRCKAGEIDIIARFEDLLCFFEVKTRNSLAFGRPSEAINKIKKRHILRTAQFYLLLNNVMEADIRVDVIEILRVDGETYINHIENAIY